MRSKLLLLLGLLELGGGCSSPVDVRTIRCDVVIHTSHEQAGDTLRIVTDSVTYHNCVDTETGEEVAYP